MLKLNIIKPRDALSKQLSKKSIVKQSLERFEAELQKLRAVNPSESEEHQKNDVKEFLSNSFGYKINTKGRIDYAVYDGSDIKVIIEAKRLDNKTEMITPNEANRKAMQEAILYFMGERKGGNDKLCRIVIANPFEWFIFDAVQFERLFWQNKEFKKRFLDFDSGKLLRKDTPYFYDEIAKPFLDGMKKDLINDETIECVYLDFKNELKDKELNAIYKLLSADYLLKAFNPNDANTLNRAFYNEFLYILGLEEAKDGGKKLIRRAATPQNGSLYENIRHKLGHQEKSSEFEVIVSIIIVWINRILFLKLLESQIYKFNGNNPAFKFLNIEKISDFDDLESLFFDVLAKPVKSRETKEFDYVPYLNSSLFERHELENKYLYLSNLRDNLTVKYYPQTVLRDDKQAKKSGDVEMLPYLFEFLDAYNFASEDSEEVIEDSKALISASVLGLIFEKLNGYRDGSFYTPSFITMYMAKESITKAVLSKFKETHGVEAADIEGLNAQLIRRNVSIDETKKVVGSLTICDPAVGSGHFLVSCLNELIYIKHRLGLFGFRELGVDIENDELYVRLGGEFHEYKKPRDLSCDNHRLQKTLFEEKRQIIENQLFGVDINPNSVNITRLRLWIELLKHTYYREDGTLETLPNIDINIKCGNSLISRFGLSDELKIKNIKHEIEHYKQAVGDYKENLGSKKEVLKSIENLKDKFKLSLKAEWKVTQARNAKLKEYASEYGYEGLGDTLVIIAVKNNYKQSGSLFGDVDEKKRAKLKKELTELQDKCDEIESGKIYENAFEWRFEFPEVLDDKGDFVGFDVVIGNPPYFNIDTFGAGSAMLGYLPQNYPGVYMDKSDILFYFIARGIEVSKGQVAYIISNAMLAADKAKKLRNHILDNAPIEKIINFEKYQVFDEANITAMMLFMDKKHNANAKVQNFKDSTYDKSVLLEQISKDSEYMDVAFKKDDIFALVDDTISAINEKIDGKHPKLGELLKVGKGMETAADDIFSIKEPTGIEVDFIKKRASGQNLKRYSIVGEMDTVLYFENVKDIGDLPQNIRDYLNEGENKKKLEDRATVKNEGRVWWRYSRPMHKEFYHLPKLFCSRRAKENIFGLDVGFNYMLFSNMTVIFGTNAELDIKYVMSLLHSKVLNFRYRSLGKQTGGGIYEYFPNEVEKFPIPKIDAKAQKPFIDLVDKILEAKKRGEDTSELEHEIDAMVYKLYNLTQEEIDVIERK